MAAVGRRFVQLALLACVLVLPDALVADVPPSAAELKAVFIFNFGSFVEWPAPAQTAPNDSFRIGIWGAPDLADALVKVVAGEKVRGRRIEILRVRDNNAAIGCHVLYIGPGLEPGVRFAELASRPILTIGETDRFEAESGIVRFVPERNRLRLRINIGQADRAQLKISSQLLRLAETRRTP